MLVFHLIYVDDRIGVVSVNIGYCLILEKYFWKMQEDKQARYVPWSSIAELIWNKQTNCNYVSDHSFNFDIINIHQYAYR